MHRNPSRHAAAASDRARSCGRWPLACWIAGAVIGANFGQTPPAVASEPTQSTIVEVDLDLAGELFAEASPEAAPVSQPIELNARFVFRETAGESEQAPVSRGYEEASASFESGGRSTTTRLAADARNLLVEVRGTTPSPYLAESFLSREEAELLDLPFDAVLVDGLRAEQAVTIGSTWSIAADLTAGLLAIDTVESGSLEARFVEVSDGVAELAIEGTVSGGVDGAPTRIEVTAACRCPATPTGDGGWLLDGRIERLEATIAERREAGWVAPGLDVTAKLTLRRTAFQETGVSEAGNDAGRHLAPASTDRPQGPGRPGVVWERHRQGRYSLVLDDRWRVVEDSSEGLVMRLIDHGALIAQCSILPLPRTSAEAAPATETVRRDVERSLGDQFGQITASEESARGDGTRLVRVVAEGTAEDRPFRWIHHVLTDPAGYRAAVTCMHEPAAAEAFAIADRELVAGLVLRPDPAREARIPPVSR